MDIVSLLLSTLGIQILLKHVAGNFLNVSLVLHQQSPLYIPDCTLNLVLFNDKITRVYRVNISDVFYYNIIHSNYTINLSSLPSGNYNLSYFIKCGKIIYIPGLTSIHLSENVLGSIVLRGEGPRYEFNWTNDKKVDFAYIDKKSFELSGSTSTYAPLVYSSRISFSFNINKKALLKIYQCSFNKCYLLYDKRVGPGFVKDFINLKERTPGEIYNIRFYVFYDGKLSDYWESPIVIPGNNPEFLIAYLNKNSTVLLFKVIDPNLKSKPYNVSLYLDNKQYHIVVPETTREKPYYLRINGTYNTVCVKIYNKECYRFDTKAYFSRIKEISNLVGSEISKVKRINISKVNNKNMSKIANVTSQTKNMNKTKGNKNYIIWILLGIVFIISAILLYKIIKRS